jgi:hypothetical protein
VPVTTHARAHLGRVPREGGDGVVQQGGAEMALGGLGDWGQPAETLRTRARKVVAERVPRRVFGGVHQRIHAQPAPEGQ